MIKIQKNESSRPHRHCAKGGHAGHKCFTVDPTSAKPVMVVPNTLINSSERANGSAGDSSVLARATEQLLLKMPKPSRATR